MAAVTAGPAPSSFRTPLRRAIAQGDVAQCRALLEAGANPNQVERGTCMLVAALKLDDPREASAKACLLLEFGADVAGRSNTVSPISIVIRRRLVDVLRAMAHHRPFIDTAVPGMGGLRAVGLLIQARWDEGLSALEAEGVDVRWAKELPITPGNPQGGLQPAVLTVLHDLRVPTKGRDAGTAEWVERTMGFLARPLPEEEMAKARVEVASVLAQKARSLTVEEFDRLEAAWKNGPWWCEEGGRMAVYRHLRELLTLTHSRLGTAKDRELPWQRVKRLVEEKNLPLDGRHDESWMEPVVETALKICATSSSSPRLLKKQLERLDWLLERGADWNEPSEFNDCSHWPAWVNACSYPGLTWKVFEPIIRRGWDPTARVDLLVRENTRDTFLPEAVPFAHAVWRAPLPFLEEFFLAHPEQVHLTDGQGNHLLHRVANYHIGNLGPPAQRLCGLVELIAGLGGDLEARNYAGAHFLHVLLDNPTHPQSDDLGELMTLVAQSHPGLMVSKNRNGVPFWRLLEEWVKKAEAEGSLFPEVKAVAHQERLKASLATATAQAGSQRL